MSGTVTATSGIQLPDWVNQAALTNYNTAMGLSQQPYTAYPGTEIAGFTPAQTAAFGAVQNQLGAAAPAFTSAMDTASGQYGALAPTFGGAQDTVGGAWGAAQPYFSGAGNIMQNLPAATQSLLNPYLSSVEGDTVSNIQRAAALQGQQIAANAQQGGAYGGTRYGVEQATLDSETQRNIGQEVDQIQSQGYNTAMSTALQQAQSMGTLGSNLVGAGVNTAQTQGQLATALGNLGLSQATTQGNLATGAQNAALQSAGALADVGSAQQQQQQATLAQQLSQWQQQQNWPYQQLAVAQSALAGSPYGTTTTSSQPYTSSNLANALSTGAAAIPAISGLYSQLFGSGSTQPFDIPQAGTSPITETQAESFTNPSVTSASDYTDPFGSEFDTLAGLGGATSGTTASGLSSFLSDAGSVGGSSASDLYNTFLT